MTVFSGIYYDGRSSQGQPVSVALHEHSTLTIRGDALQREVALQSVDISARLGNTVRSVTLPDGATIETTEHTALDELAQRMGQGQGLRWVHALESNWRAALGATAVLAVLFGVGIVWGIPLLAERAARAIPDKMAYDIGSGTLAVLDRSVLEESGLNETRRDELRKSFSVVADEYPDLPLHLVFRQGVGANAFALPDGTVVLTDELVELAKNDEQIVSVLAHEVGHVHHRHGLRMALESSVVVLLVSTYVGDVSQLTTLSATLPGVYAQARYSRSHETEADSFALQYMDQAHIPHQRFADILCALSAAHKQEQPSGFDYLASHPPTEERVRRFEN